MATLTVRVFEASKLKVTQTFGRQSPYVTVKLGQQLWTSQVHRDGHEHAAVNDGRTFQLAGETYMRLEAWNRNAAMKDSFIGAADIPLHEAVRNGQDTLVLNIFDKGQAHAGQVELELSVAQASAQQSGRPQPRPQLAAPPHAYPTQPQQSKANSVAAGPPAMYGAACTPPQPPQQAPAQYAPGPRASGAYPQPGSPRGHSAPFPYPSNAHHSPRQGNGASAPVFPSVGGHSGSPSRLPQNSAYPSVYPNSPPGQYGPPSPPRGAHGQHPSARAEGRVPAYPSIGPSRYPDPGRTSPPGPHSHARPGTCGGSGGAAAFTNPYAAAPHQGQQGPAGGGAFTNPYAAGQPSSDVCYSSAQARPTAPRLPDRR